MNERVSAVVATHNRRQELLECVNALRAQTRPPDEILIIDNAGDDGTGDWQWGDEHGVRGGVTMPQ